MFRPACFLFALLSAAGVVAQDTLSHALLWRVSDPEGALGGYLYGTIHSRDDRAFQFGDSVLPALYRCRSVAGELDPGEVAASSLALLSRMQLPDGKRLEDLYRKRQWRAVSAVMEAKLGPMAGLVHRTRPVFVLAMLAEEDMAGDRAEVLDDHLLGLAAANGQEVRGLETVAEQVAALDVLSLQQEADMLWEHARDPEAQHDELQRLLRAYAEQDLPALMRQVQGTGGLPAELERSMLDDRNRHMVDRMDTTMREAGTCFFAVGAAHLPGVTGAINGLRERGWVVVPVDPRPR